MPTINYYDFNTLVLGWSVQAAQTIRMAAGAMNIQHRPVSPSLASSVARISSAVSYESGVINKITFRFPKSLAYVHHGAGRGQGGVKGSKWIDARGDRKQTNPRSLGKQDSGNRWAKPFFNNAMTGAGGVDALADIVAETIGDSVIDNILIK